MPADVPLKRLESPGNLSFLTGEDEADHADADAVFDLAQSFLDRKDEDWTYVDPEDVKRLARAVLGK